MSPLLLTQPEAGRKGFTLSLLSMFRGTLLRSDQTVPGWLVLPGTRSCPQTRPGTTNTDQATIGPMIAISAL